MRSRSCWTGSEICTHVGSNCEIPFYPQRSSEELHRHLLRNGYGDWWFAHRSGLPWGVRSRFRGVQLQARSGGRIDAHVDSFNPGDPETGELTGALNELGGAIEHKFADDWFRGTDGPAKVWPVR